MSSAGVELENKLAEMRRLFDQSFAAAEQRPAGTKEQMIAVTVAGKGLAVRLSEISGLAVSRGTILPVPSRVPELLGITGVRGTVVPVFSLAALLGFSSNATEPRWLMFCGAKQAPVAFAFDELEGHFEVPGTDVYVREAERGYVNETARDGSRLRAVIGIARLVHQVTQRKQPGS